jgi:hypothetical protein
MHRSEETTLLTCSDCGTEVRPAADRLFSFGERGVLCFDCALRRGGSYDEVHDLWSRDPHLEDLAPDFE